jgi:hypothetical protein
MGSKVGPLGPRTKAVGPHLFYFGPDSLQVLRGPLACVLFRLGLSQTGLIKEYKIIKESGPAVPAGSALSQIPNSKRKIMSKQKGNICLEAGQLMVQLSFFKCFHECSKFLIPHFLIGGKTKEEQKLLVWRYFLVEILLF